MLSLNQLYDFYLLLVFAQQRVSPYDHEGRKNGCFSLYQMNMIMSQEEELL